MRAWIGWLVVVLACTGRPAITAPPAMPVPGGRAPESAPALVELCESVPSGAMADDPEVANTDVVWRAMIAGAERSIAICQFYVSTKPKAHPGEDRLDPVMAELEAAVARGVSVRLLVDAQFGNKHPESLQAMKSRGVVVRELDAAKIFGGVQHAKYMVIDRSRIYVGSANFDWRALDHIHELGLRIDSHRLAGGLLSVYDADWARAGGEPAPPPRELRQPIGPELLGEHAIEVVLSPKGFLPDERSWELPRILEAIDGAKRELRVQVLTFETVGHDGESFTDLDHALRRAAMRGVRVRLLVSHWQKSAKKIRAVQSLAREPGIDVRIVTVPEAASGFIPFARVIHAKYMVADDSLVWLGSSNWGGDYFFRSRNAGVMVRSPPLAKKLARVFDGLAAGPLAEPVDPDKAYEPPKIASF